jgi:hypothetical protein
MLDAIVVAEMKDLDVSEISTSLEEIMNMICRGEMKLIER